ncbi:RDD family protein [Alisedimentitalea sp. MJ-SS2]|uniref:RDD family protein n=1 Tax=Aliisedimentitalea sp. MJ-SS2 TaxID=3049795 RepID=UPI0029069AA6|nr:RDD family protein [Alisedimentitalea sp. MJ-SS2]MDU8926466.1 RDD family protein [Alisedimentitalea sp. MJ-SS2]
MTPDWRLPDPHFQPEFYRDVPLKRFLAFLMDTALLLVISVILVVLTLGLAALLIIPTWWLLNFAYRAISLANWSATPAMRFLAIEFRNADGTRFSLGDAFAHTLGFMLSFTFFPVQVLSMVLMATSPRAQGLTDNILGTVAINRRAGR